MSTEVESNVSFDYRTRQQWMESNWQMSFTFTAVYLSSIVIGQLIMKSKPAYNLRSILTLWNGGLAIFSILATLRTLPELITILQGENGLYDSVCSKW